MHSLRCVLRLQLADGSKRGQRIRGPVQLDHCGDDDRADAGAVAVRVVAEGHHRAGHRRVHGAHHHRKHTGTGVVHRGPDHPAAEQLFHRLAGRYGHADR